MKKNWNELHLKDIEDESYFAIHFQIQKRNKNFQYIPEDLGSFLVYFKKSNDCFSIIGFISDLTENLNSDFFWHGSKD